MRLLLTAMIAGLPMTTVAMAQRSGGVPPVENGNRANGLDYQPTPSEVIPREKAAGVQPPASQLRSNGQFLEHLDKTLLRDEGLSTKSVPNLAPAK